MLTDDQLGLTLEGVSSEVRSHVESADSHVSWQNFLNNTGRCHYRRWQIGSDFWRGRIPDEDWRTLVQFRRYCLYTLRYHWLNDKPNWLWNFIAERWWWRLATELIWFIFIDAVRMTSGGPVVLGVSTPTGEPTPEVGTDWVLRPGCRSYNIRDRGPPARLKAIQRRAG